MEGGARSREGVPVTLISPAPFVDLVDGGRTYVATFDAHANFGAAFDAGTRAERKVAAIEAIRAAEAPFVEAITPQLDALQGAGLVLSYEFVPHTGAVIINTDDSNAAAAWQALRGIGELGRIERNREVRLIDDAPATASIPTPVTPRVEWGVTKVRAPELWDQELDGDGIVVGVFDSGLAWEHEAIAPHYRGSDGDHDYAFYDAVNGRTEAYDDNSHGTHVAGTIAGGTDERTIGVAPGATLIAAKVLNDKGSGSTANMLKGMSWMLEPTDSSGRNRDASKAPDVINHSWQSSPGVKTAYLGAWRNFEGAGIIQVAAAGNKGPDPETVTSPGAYGYSLTSGSVDRGDRIARSSGRGPVAGRDGIDKPDVVAPGVSIASALPSGGYGTKSGTSMASPHLAGVVALLLQAHPSLTRDELHEALTSTAVDLGDSGYDHDYGHGRIDAVAALDAAGRIVAARIAQ